MEGQKLLPIKYPLVMALRLWLQFCFQALVYQIFNFDATLTSVCHHPIHPCIYSYLFKSCEAVPKPPTSHWYPICITQSIHRNNFSNFCCSY